MIIRGRRRSFNFFDCRNVIARIAKTACRQSYLLLVMQDDTPSHRVVDSLNRLLIPYSKIKFLRKGTRHGNHCQFTFPGFTHPAFLGKFLYPAGSLAGCVTPHESQPKITDTEKENKGKPDENFKFQIATPFQIFSV